ncbi:hypothetical protein EV122DRAFT_294907 [Schizophyllum commune]
MPLLNGSSPPRPSARTTGVGSKPDAETRPRQSFQLSSLTTHTTSQKTQPALISRALQPGPSTDIRCHLLDVQSTILTSRWDSVTPSSPTARLPPSIVSLTPASYFDRFTHRIHLPRPIVAVFKVSERISTVYFTLTELLDIFGIPTSQVVYASVSHNPMVGLDLLFPTKEIVRPLTREAHEVDVSLFQLNERIHRHMCRQHLFMHYARMYSQIRLYYQRHARIRTPDSQATTTIPGIPYFEEYMFHHAKPQAWLCEDITEIFDPPDLNLTFIA